MLTNALEPRCLEVSFGGSKIVAHYVTPSAGQDLLNRPKVILCHFSHLGTSIQFQRDSLLSYIEGCRTIVEAQSVPQRDLVPSMPCKVLSIQKARAVEVKAGDLVMVIESMGMKVSLKTTKESRFETEWKAEDAVDESQVLCRIT